VSIIADCIFRAVELAVTDSGARAGTMIRIAPRDAQAGHRTVIGRVMFENLNAGRILELISTKFDVIGHANFGRIIDQCEAVIYAEGAGGDGLGVSSVNMHNIAGNQSPAGESRMIDLRSIRNVTVSGCVFVPFVTDQKVITIENGTCSNVHVDRSQARAFVG
jgi:hypothetical protein